MAIRDWFNNLWRGANVNPYNRAFFSMIQGRDAEYDYNRKTYLEKGLINPDLFAVLSQMSDKTKSVPFYVYRVKDQNKAKKYTNSLLTTKGEFTPKQSFDRMQLKSQAYESEEIAFPLENPNPLQSWSEFLALYKMYLKLTGNVYILKVAPSNGPNKGAPRLVYILPSHLVKIVLKKDVNLIYDESPIDRYMLVEGDQFIEFKADDVIHIKYANPHFDFNGTHLYGLSPIAALLKNLESSNEALDGNVKTMKNSGVFGFVSAKDKPLTEVQATDIYSHH